MGQMRGRGGANAVRRTAPAGRSAEQPQPSKTPLSVAQAAQTLRNRPAITALQSDPANEIGFNRSVPSAYSGGDYGQIEELPPITSVGDDGFNALMQKKLQQCRIICNYQDAMADLKSKAVKQGYLQEVLSCVSIVKVFRMFEAETFRLLFTMIKVNLLRAIPPLPPLSRAPVVGDDITDTIYEGAWPHIELVYQIFLKFLESAAMEPQQFVQYIDRAFITRFLAVFGSGDQREREQAKLTLHRVYVKFVPQRALIRQALQDVLTVIGSGRVMDCFPGVGELLEIIVSIINGLSLPLKAEHLGFLRRVLIPLYGSDFLHQWHPKLLLCMIHYTTKDPRLSVDVIRGLLRLWPQTSHVKELLFIASLARMLESVPPELFSGLAGDVYKRIAMCAGDDHFQVAEAAMLLWRNDWFIQQTVKYAAVAYPILSQHLYRTGTSHWNQAIRNLAVSVIRIMLDTQREAFDEAGKRLRQGEETEEEARKKSWRRLGGLATSHGKENQPLVEGLEAKLR